MRGLLRWWLLTIHTYSWKILTTHEKKSPPLKLAVAASNTSFVASYCRMREFLGVFRVKTNTRNTFLKVRSLQNTKEHSYQKFQLTNLLESWENRVLPRPVMSKKITTFEESLNQNRHGKLFNLFQSLSKLQKRVGHTHFTWKSAAACWKRNISRRATLLLKKSQMVIFSHPSCSQVYG